MIQDNKIKMLLTHVKKEEGELNLAVTSNEFSSPYRHYDGFISRSMKIYSIDRLYHWWRKLWQIKMKN
ncbi:MAG: hypothetical protein NWF08_00900 [Candidatus Bathyarchaeota archaeon]|nr:hypothetical protein [Candidatus Bathyarchaeota archaeon]